MSAHRRAGLAVLAATAPLLLSCTVHELERQALELAEDCDRA